MVAGSGMGTGFSSFCIMRSMSWATGLLRFAMSETSVRGARTPRVGSMVISSTVWDTVWDTAVFSGLIFFRVRLAVLGAVRGAGPAGGDFFVGVSLGAWRLQGRMSER